MKIYVDGADLESFRQLKEIADGFTTNPTLMAKAGITNYIKFAKELLSFIDKPVSFEVFSDDFNEMYDQAKKLHTLANNVYVKIPITNSKGDSSMDLIRELSSTGIKVNVTAVFTISQILETYNALDQDTPSVISVFAGRISDTLQDPMPTMIFAQRSVNKPRLCEVLWASTREVYNIHQAERAKCDIITVSPDLLKKYHKLKNYNLKQYSLDTVKMFKDDAEKAGFVI
jgi:transaldolase